MQAHIRELEAKVVKLKAEIELRTKVIQVIIIFSLPLSNVKLFMRKKKCF